MSQIKSKRLSSPIAFFQLSQQGLYVNIFDLLTELRLEHSACQHDGDYEGQREIFIVTSYLQLILDSTPIDGPVITPADYLAK